MAKQVKKLSVGTEEFRLQTHPDTVIDIEDQAGILENLGVKNLVSFQRSVTCSAYCFLVKETDTHKTYSVRLEMVFHRESEIINALDYVQKVTFDYYPEDIYAEDGTENETTEAIMIRTTDYFVVEITIKNPQHICLNIETVYGNILHPFDLVSAPEFYVGINSTGLYKETCRVETLDRLAGFDYIPSNPGTKWIPELDIDLEKLSVGSYDDDGVCNVTVTDVADQNIIVGVRGGALFLPKVSYSDNISIPMDLLGSTQIHNGVTWEYYLIYISHSVYTFDKLDLKITL